MGEAESAVPGRQLDCMRQCKSSVVSGEVKGGSGEVGGVREGVGGVREVGWVGW